MLRYRRNRVPGGTYFFTVTLHDRKFELLTDHIALLGNAFREVRSRRPFVLDAIVVLPDHLHTVMTLPEDDVDYSGRWRAIKSAFSRGLRQSRDTARSHERRAERVWQSRFWEHTIASEADLERHVDYIHWNPVKHGLVTKVSEWPYSSFHRYVRRGLLPENWAGGSANDDGGGFGE